MASRRSSQLSYSRADVSSISAPAYGAPLHRRRLVWVLALALVFVAGAVIGAGDDAPRGAAPGPAGGAASPGPRHERRPAAHAGDPLARVAQHRHADRRPARARGAAPRGGRGLRDLAPGEGRGPQRRAAPMELAAPHPHAAARPARPPRARIRRRRGSSSATSASAAAGRSLRARRAATRRTRTASTPTSTSRAPTGCPARRSPQPGRPGRARRTSSTASWPRARRRSSSAGGYGSTGRRTSCSTGPATATTCTSASGAGIWRSTMRFVAPTEPDCGPAVSTASAPGLRPARSRAHTSAASTSPSTVSM